jgi:hypothetical protein
LTSGGPCRAAGGGYIAPAVENEIVKRLLWSGLLAGIGAVASIATTRAAGAVWRALFHEEPPE